MNEIVELQQFEFNRGDLVEARETTPLLIKGYQYEVLGASVHDGNVVYHLKEPVTGDCIFTLNYFKPRVDISKDIPVEVDDVNHPNHYLQGGIETIDIVEMVLTPEEFAGYLKGNIIKYRERAQFKGTAEKDYKKAKWYKDKLDSKNKPNSFALGGFIK